VAPYYEQEILYVVTNLITPCALSYAKYSMNFVKPEIALFDPPTQKTHPRTKHEVDRTTLSRDMAIWNFQNWHVCRSARSSI